MVGASARICAAASTWLKPWQAASRRGTRDWAPAFMSPVTESCVRQRKCGAIGMERSTIRISGACRLDRLRQLRAVAGGEVALHLLGDDAGEGGAVRLLDRLHALRLQLGDRGRLGILVH